MNCAAGRGATADCVCGAACGFETTTEVAVAAMLLLQTSNLCRYQMQLLILYHSTLFVGGS